MDEHQQNTSDDFFYCYGAEKNVETTINEHIYICGRNYEYFTVKLCLHVQHSVVNRVRPW